MKKRGVCLALAGILTASVIGLAGCGSKKGENELWITYYKGGYGNEWAEQLARKFEAEHEGVTVRTDADTSLIDAVPNMMKNGTDYDLIFCHDVAWEDFVNPGYIHNLDDLYKTEIDGNGTTFADRIWDENVLDSSRYRLADGTEHYYKVPWTIGTAGMAYNVTVMNRLNDWLQKNNKGHVWNEPPKDVYELLQYCEDIIEAKMRIDPSEPTSDYITPFTWSGKSEAWQWDYIVFDWWGQLAGPETVNTFKNFGNVNDKFEIDWTKTKDPNKEVFNPTKKAVERNADGTVNKESSTYIGWWEFTQAYTLWYDFVARDAKWSATNIGSYGKFENENAFASGYAAMTPAACWVEKEASTYLEASGQEISIMPTPTISHVKLDSDGKILPKDATNYAVELDAIHADAGVSEKTIKIGDDTYNRVSFTSSFGDSVMIPNRGKGGKAKTEEQLKLAEEFILFMQKEENAQMFTRLSGGTVLPYKYNYADSFKVAGETATKWQASIFEIDANSTKFNNYTKHPMMRSTNLKGTARMTSVWPTNEYYYYKAWVKASDYTVQKLFVDEIYGKKLSDGMWNLYKSTMA